MAKNRIERDELASKLMETASSGEDPLRAMAELLTDFVMEAEVTAKVGAEAHERSEERTTHRNGHRERRWDTRLGTLRLQVPKLREGGYVPSFIEHRKRSEQALISVIQEAVVKGVSTRKIEAVLEQLGIAGVSAGRKPGAETVPTKRGHNSSQLFLIGGGTGGGTVPNKPGHNLSSPISPFGKHAARGNGGRKVCTCDMTIHDDELPGELYRLLFNTLATAPPPRFASARLTQRFVRTLLSRYHQAWRTQLPFISLTRLRIRSIRFLPFFAVLTIRALQQVKKASGFQTGALLPDRDWTFWTLTAWDSPENMRLYMTNEAHKKAMPHLMHWCDEASVAHWTQDEASLPTWEEADRKMRESGRASKVHHPSPQHATLTYRAPRTSRFAPIRRA